jgi:hypothetical protein
MNAHEIQQIENDVNASFRLPLSFEAWADVERRAREERARVIGQSMSNFFGALAARLARLGRDVRRTAADCTDARLNHG